MIIVWWMHQAEHVVLKVNVEGLTDDDRSVGIFATRFPARVNPIALSVVELIGIEGCFLNVRGFDGWNDTPVLDIKPYDYYDMVKSPKVPEWFANFWQEHKQKRRYTETVGWLGP